MPLGWWRELPSDTSSAPRGGLLLGFTREFTPGPSVIDQSTDPEAPKDLTGELGNGVQQGTRQYDGQT
jgi:hypothetical protein